MAWKNNIKNIFIKISKIPSLLIRPSKPRSSDFGIFDPYVPLGALKEIKEDFNQGPAPFVEDSSFVDTSESKKSFVVFKVLVVLVASLFMFRFVALQITQGQENFRLAEGNRLSTKPILPARGLLYDRNGTVLVQNVPSYSLTLYPGKLPPRLQEREEAIENIASALDLDIEELRDIVERNRNRETVALREAVSREEALSYELRLDGMPSVELTTTAIRYYPEIESLGHMLGYVTRVTSEELRQRRDLLAISYTGKSGVELIYDELLQGSLGVETVEVDSRGRALRSVGVQPSLPGRSLLLSVDLELQRASTQALFETMQQTGATSAALVVMDVNTGDVLSMVSLPYFDANIFSPLGDRELRRDTLEDRRSPLMNRAISGQYPAGSTVKPIVAAGALQEGVVSESTTMDTSAGRIEVGQWVFPDWRVHGMTNVRQAIAESNNIFFYAVGGGHRSIRGLGINKLSDYYKMFGFSDRTGIDLPSEQRGLVPNPEWKLQNKKERWYIGDTYNTSIGQGDLLVTPLQLTRAIAAIANDGKLLTPRVVTKILSDEEDRIEDVPVEVVGRVSVDSMHLEVVRQGMRRTVLSGSARSFSDMSVEVAAKTGTAQFDVAKERTHSWFTAFAPYRNPEIALSVIVEGGGEGYAVSAPIARRVIEAYFSRIN